MRRDDEATLVNTLEHIAKLIYEGEIGAAHARADPARAAQPGAAAAVAAPRPAADPRRDLQRCSTPPHRAHARQRAGGKLLSDVGGPYVLAPVTAPLRLHGRTIGSAVLSIQDDEGYLRLTRRLAGLRVLMYMDGASGQPNSSRTASARRPGSVPAERPLRTTAGSTSGCSRSTPTAFPSGPLTIRVLIPIPYS